MRNNENSIQATDLTAARMQYILGEVFLTYAYKRMKEGSVCDDPEQPFTDDWIITYRALSEAIADKEEMNDSVVDIQWGGDQVAPSPELFKREEYEQGKPTIYITNRGALLNDVEKMAENLIGSILIYADQLTTFNFSEYLCKVPPALIIADCPINFDYKYWSSLLKRIKINKKGGKIIEFSPIVYFFTVYPLPIDEAFVSSFIIEDWTVNI